MRAGVARHRSPSAVTEFVSYATPKIAETKPRFCLWTPAKSSAWPFRPAEAKPCIPVEVQQDWQIPP